MHQISQSRIDPNQHAGPLAVLRLMLGIKGESWMMAGYGTGYGAAGMIFLPVIAVILGLFLWNYFQK